ncbi:MAG: DUF4197 domain-containing protein [Tibeticola sp.]
MDRRKFNVLALATSAAGLLTGGLSHAQLAALRAGDASKGVRAALEKGVAVAVDLLGRPDGFLGNPQVRIPLPGPLEDAARLLRPLGMGGRIDELVMAMNRAAEAAVPLSRDLLMAAVRGMTVNDAAAILTGGPTSVTDFFAQRTRTPLAEKFLPVVARATERVALADKYNRVAAKAAGMGLLRGDETNVQRYVTGKTLDGLYFMIGEEEKKIRQDPVGSGSAILQKVFGALK